MFKYYISILGGGGGGGGGGLEAHWAWESREVALKSQTWKCQMGLELVLDSWALVLDSVLWSIFELEMFPFLFQMGRVLPEIEWYHY